MILRLLFTRGPRPTSRRVDDRQRVEALNRELLRMGRVGRGEEPPDRYRPADQIEEDV